MYHTNIPNSYFMRTITVNIDDANTRNSSKQIKIINNIRNRSSPVLISQMDDKIIQANHTNNVYSSASLCMWFMCADVYSVSCALISYVVLIIMEIII